MIKVLICDDQDIVCEGLQAILSSDAELQVVGLAYGGAQAVQLAMELQPDVVLMDLKMPDVNGVEATQQIRQHQPETRVLVLTTYDADEWVFDAIRSGASGYLLKDTPRETLISAIKGTAQGQTYVGSTVAGKLFSHIAQGGSSLPTAALDQLNERERELLQLIGRGLSNAEIAAKLHLSHGTVRNYLSALFEKLDVTDRTQAALLALRYGLVD
jgi:DNA-binding NarL/FixJ family response regulator